FIVKRDTLNAREMANRILEATGYLKELEGDDDTESQARAQNIREFLNAVEEYLEQSEDKSTAGFLEQVSLVADADEIEFGPNYVTPPPGQTPSGVSGESVGRPGGGVTLMTVHLAKGLEF